MPTCHGELGRATMMTPRSTSTTATASHGTGPRVNWGAERREAELDAGTVSAWVISRSNSSTPFRIYTPHQTSYCFVRQFLRSTTECGQRVASIVRSTEYGLGGRTAPASKVRNPLRGSDANS